MGKKLGLKSKQGEITAKEIEELTYPEDMGDDDILVPVDISEAGEDFPTAYEEMVEKLGPRAAVEAIVEAEKVFNKNSRPIPMTVGEWLVQLGIEAAEEEADEDEE